MKVLVTGGMGFIGSHLVDALVKRGEDVRCLIRKTSDVSHLKKLGVELVYGDITKIESLKKAVEDIEVVYHLVGIGDVSAISEEAYKTFYKINVLGTKNLLDACLSVNLKRFIHFSSLAAMGLIKDISINETTLCNPITPYEKSKYESEEVVLRYWKENELSVTIIRPSMVYGLGDIKSEILKMSKLIQKHIFPIIGSGSNLMAFVYVDDIVQGTILAGENKNAIGKIYIITDKRSYTLNEVVHTIATELNIKIPAIHIPIRLAKIGIGSLEVISKIFKFSPPFTLRRINSITIDRVYDISKAKKELGYIPNVSLKEGMKRTIEWYKKEGYLK